MDKCEGLNMGGVSILRAWRAGLLPDLIHRYGYEDAMKCADGFHVYRSAVHNLIVTSGKVMVGNMLRDTAGYDTGLTYHAIGTGSTAPAIANTTLTTEAARKVWTNKSQTIATVTFSVFYTAAQCTYNIKECGIFGHSTAGATANSGILFSHYLQAYDNSAGSFDLTFDYVLTIGV